MLHKKKIIEKWVLAFNNANIAALGELYAEDAINLQQPNGAVVGREAIMEMFQKEFAAAPFMHCIPLQIIAEGNWCVLEWKDPKEFPGCVFFEIMNGKIKTQRGYWDKLSFQQLYPNP
jgi:predicted ester cyclase